MTDPILRAWPLVLLLLLLAGCQKDEEVGCTGASASIDGRDRFVGSYAVYDTLGTYLYWMTVSKFGTGGRDSLLLTNYADTFDLRILHERYWTSAQLDIDSWFPAIDYAGHSWALSGASIEDGSNVLTNDTVPLKFTMNNIAFYWQEGVPYFSCVCKQVAVKQ